MKTKQKQAAKQTTYQELFLLLLGRFVVETTSLNDLVVDIKLVSSTREHRLLYALLRDEPQDADHLRLTDTMGTILRLEISMRVPITVEARNPNDSVLEKLGTEVYAHDDSVSGLQVETKTTSTR